MILGPCPGLLARSEELLRLPLAEWLQLGTEEQQCRKRRESGEQEGEMKTGRGERKRAWKKDQIVWVMDFPPHEFHRSPVSLSPMSNLDLNLIFAFPPLRYLILFLDTMCTLQMI